MITLPVTTTPIPAGTTTGTAPAATGDNSNLGLGGTQLNTQDFISILTAQLQYQDPLNPANPNQFVSEMAQFGSLNELIGIKTDLDQSLQNAQTPPAPQTTAAAGKIAPNPTAKISQ